MFIFLLKITVAGCSKEHLKFQYVYISTEQLKRKYEKMKLKIPICLYFYRQAKICKFRGISLKFQYVYISTVRQHSI